MTETLKPRPHSRLVEHDIKLSRSGGEGEESQVQATVMCERKRRAVSIDECKACERFARIEVHEAGYVMLCRSADLDDSVTEQPCDSGDTMPDE